LISRRIGVQEGLVLQQRDSVLIRTVVEHPPGDRIDKELGKFCLVEAEQGRMRSHRPLSLTAQAQGLRLVLHVELFVFCASATALAGFGSSES
jgi:hypothetical protein